MSTTTLPARTSAKAFNRAVPLLRSESTPNLCRPGHVPSVRNLSVGRREETERSIILSTSTSAKSELVRLEEYETAENIFTDYAYFSSYCRFLAQTL